MMAMTVHVCVCYRRDDEPTADQDAAGGGRPPEGDPVRQSPTAQPRAAHSE